MFLSGNEAVAHAAENLRVRFITGYPGVPSTEIVETAIRRNIVKAEWAVNEKAALEAAIGVSFTGERAICAVKDLGLNFAADVFFGIRAASVNGGLVIISCDDSGRVLGDDMNDSRMYAVMAEIPLFEATTVQDVYDLVHYAMEISEQYSTVAMIRLTALVTHQYSDVDISRYQVGPGGRSSRYVANTIQSTVAEFSPESAIRSRTGGYCVDRKKRLSDVGTNSFMPHLLETRFVESDYLFIGSGVSIVHAKTAYPDQSHIVLKMVNPINIDELLPKIREYKRVFVVEESAPILEEQLVKSGIRAEGSVVFLRGTGAFRLSPDIIRASVERHVGGAFSPASEYFPIQLPSLCPGCSHLFLFDELKKHVSRIFADSGCYAVNLYPPYSSIDAFVVMGSSVALAHGFEKSQASNTNNEKCVAVIGDGVFFHSGIPPIINAIYNESSVTIVIADNSCIAMTGRQSTGVVEAGLDIEYILRAIGVRDVRTVSPYDTEALGNALESALAADEVSVVVCKSRCLKLANANGSAVKVGSARIIADRCLDCGICTSLGCVAIERRPLGGEMEISINQNECVGCGFCSVKCPAKAIEVVRVG